VTDFESQTLSYWSETHVLLQKNQSNITETLWRACDGARIRSRALSGRQSDSWDEVVSADWSPPIGKNTTAGQRYRLHRRNHTADAFASIKDTALEGKTPDVLIIGGGIIGCSIARECARYDMDILLVEKENDVAMQTTSRNDGMVTRDRPDSRTSQTHLQYARKSHV
jgi:glycerol-3-phosphate dehydrogenase